MEGAFVLQPPTHNKQPPPALPAELQPTVGVSVTLRREEVAPQVHDVDVAATPSDLVHVFVQIKTFDKYPVVWLSFQSMVNKEGRGRQPSVSPSAPPPSVPTLIPSAELRPQPSAAAKPPDAPLPPPSSHTESEAGSLLEELEQERGGEAHSANPPNGRRFSSVQESEELHTEAAASSVSVSAPKVSIPSSAHHFCFSLDLRSLGKLSLTHPIAASLRYEPICCPVPGATELQSDEARAFQVFVPVLWQRGSDHDQPSRGAAEEHGGVSASVLLCL